MGLVGSQFPGGLGLGTFKGRNVGLGRGLRLETPQLVPDSVFPQTCFSLVFVSRLGQDGELGPRSRKVASPESWVMLVGSAAAGPATAPA